MSHVHWTIEVIILVLKSSSVYSKVFWLFLYILYLILIFIQENECVYPVYKDAVKELNRLRKILIFKKFKDLNM